MPDERAASSCGKLALALVSTTLVLGGSELSLRRLWTPKGSPMVQGFGQLMWMDEDPRLLWRYKPNLRVRLRDPSEGSYVTNSMRYRGPEIPDPPGRPLIVCAGDSVTAGFQVPDARSYPYVLQELLRATPGNERARVINIAVPGYSSEQGKVAVRRAVKRFRPDVAVLCFGVNDTFTVTKADRALMGLPGWLLEARYRLRKLRLYQGLEHLIARARVREAVIDRSTGPRVDLDRYAENLDAMARIVAEHGGSAIMVAPTSREEHHQRPTTPPISMYREVMARVAGAAGAPYVDVPLLSGRLPESRRRFADWCHPDTEGLCILAQHLLPVVQEALDRRPAWQDPGRP